MGSTNVPTHKEVKKVRIQCTTPYGEVFDFNLEMSKFQEVLRTVIGCKYQTAGCIINDHVQDIIEHEACCLYRTIRCPMQSEEEEALCESIQPVNLIDHISEHHNSDYVFTEENFVSLSIDVDEDIQLSKLIKMHEHVILCRVKSEAQTLRTSLLSIKNTNGYLNCNIILTADNETRAEENITISNANAGFNENGGKAAVFQLEELRKSKRVCVSIIIGMNFKIPTQEIRLLRDPAFEYICSSCKDFLTEFCYRCKPRHTLCSVCYHWHKCCPICRIVSSTPISIKVENSLFKKYKYPCENEALGCKEYIPYSPSNHELLCPFKTFVCTLCPFTSKYAEFIMHLKEDHADCVVNADVYNVYDKYISQSGWRDYMFVFGSVFLCDYDKTAQRYTIEWISSSDLEQTFRFVVTFVYDDLKKICLSVGTDHRVGSYLHNYYKAVFNMNKKIATFILCTSVTNDVQNVTFNIYKDN